MEGKKCKDCGEIKDVGQFRKGRKQCNDCRKLYYKEWLKQNPDIRRKSRKKYRENNAEKMHQYSREYKKTHKDIVYADNRKWRERHPGKVKEQRRKWVSRNRERRRFLQKLSNARRRGAKGTFSFAQWKTLCDYYGSKCLCCGRRFDIEIDHVVAVTSGGDNVISNVQPLCQTCNRKKFNQTIDYRYDKGEFAVILEKYSK